MTESMQEISLTEKELVELNEDNFAVNTKLGFDIRVASQLRYFLSNLLYIKAQAENLILLSFDNEDTLRCQNWTIEIDYNFNDIDEVTVSKTAEYSSIKCLPAWRQIIGYNVDDEAPIRKQESYFINYISLFCNICTYYFVVSHLVHISKFHRLEKQRRIKLRWIEQKKNVEDFKRVSKAWEGQNPKVFAHIYEETFFGLSNIALIVSNSFLLLSNIFILLSATSLELDSESNIDRIVKIFLGIGCSLSWINIVTLLANVEKFQVVGNII